MNELIVLICLGVFSFGVWFIYRIRLPKKKIYHFTVELMKSAEGKISLGPIGFEYYEKHQLGADEND